MRVWGKQSSIDPQHLEFGGEQGHDQKIKSLGLLEWNNKALVLN